MNKTVKRIVIIVAAVIAAGAAVWGGLKLLRSAQRQPVNVYSVQSFAMTEYWGDSSETYGMVTTDKLQKVYLSATQTISEIFVYEGQMISAGDSLLAYDTTLSSLDVEKAEIAYEKLKLDLATAQRELVNLQNAASSEYLQNTLSSLEQQLEEELAGLPAAQVTFPELPLGSWTPDSPRYIEEPALLDIDALFEESEREDFWVVLVEVSNGSYLDYQGLHIMRDDEMRIKLRLFEADPLAEIPADVPDSDRAASLRQQIASVENLLASSYSSSELAQMRSDKQKEIVNLELQIRIAENELERKRREVDDGIIRSEIDGVVRVLRDPNEAFAENLPVIEVSGGGGYYITGTLSELELDTVQIGQYVDVNSWMTGAYCQGEVVEIGTYPASSAQGWTDGNNNVSWYPFTVFVDEDANLQENDYVSIMYSSGGSGGDSWYLENMFIRTENGRSYVYVRGEDGQLEQRWISTGRGLWDYYTEILGGLTLDDYVAFPYGRDVGEGARTVEATPDELYNSY